MQSSEVCPLQASSYPLANISKQDVIENPAVLYPFIIDDEGVHVTDGLKRPCPTLDRKLRDKLLSERLIRFLPVYQHVGVGRLTQGSRFMEKVECVMLSTFLMEKKIADLAVYFSMGQDSNVSTNQESEDFIKLLPGIRGFEDKQYFELHHPKSEVDSECWLCLYNHSWKTGLIMYKNSQLTELMDGEGIVLRYPGGGTSGWVIESQYKREPIKSVDMNPLVRDQKKAAGQIAVGEYFLPPEAVQDLVGSQIDSGIKPPVYHFSGASKLDFHALKAIASGIKKKISHNDAFSFIVMNDSECHMVAIRMRCKDGQVMIYIHETLSPDALGTRAIRDFVIAGAQKAISNYIDHKIFCITTPVPDKTGMKFQKDFRSCGSIAIDALVYFETGEFDAWVSEVIHGRKGQWIQKENEFFDEAVESVDCGSLKSAKKSKYVKEIMVLWEAVPAPLLKHFMGDQMLLTEDQLTSRIDEDNRTLSEHFMMHRGKGKSRNHYSTGMTYKNLLMWEKMILGFESISLDMPFNDVKGWLKKYHGFSISQNDWSMLNEYNNVMHTEAPLREWSEAELKQWAEGKKPLVKWLGKLVGSQKLDKKNKEFIYPWCQFINDTVNTEFNALWLNQPPESLLHLIRKNIDEISRHGCCDADFHAGAAAFLGSPKSQCNLGSSINPSHEMPGQSGGSEDEDTYSVSAVTDESSKDTYCASDTTHSEQSHSDTSFQSEDTLPAILECSEASVEAKVDEKHLQHEFKPEVGQTPDRLHRKRRFLPAILDHRPKKERLSLPFASATVEKTDSNLPAQNISEQGWEVLFARARSYMDRMAYHNPDKLEVTRSFDSQRTVVDDDIPTGVWQDEGSVNSSLVDTELLVPWVLATAIPSVKMDGVSPEPAAVTETKPLFVVGTEEQSAILSTQETALLTPEDCSAANDWSTVKAQEGGGELTSGVKPQSLQSDARHVDVCSGLAVPDFSDLDSKNAPASIKTEPFDEELQPCSHNLWPTGMANQSLQVVEKEESQVGMDRRNRLTQVGPDGFFKIKVEDSSYTLGLQRLDHVVSDDESVSSKVAPLESKHEVVNCSRKRVSLADREEYKRRRKEKNKQSVKAAREKKKNELDALKLEVSSFVDIQRIEIESKNEAKKIITLDFIKAFLTNDCYSHYPVFKKHPSTILALVAMSYGLNEAGQPLSVPEEDRKALKAFMRKVKNAINAQVSRKYKIILKENLERTKNQCSGTIASHQVADQLLPYQL